MKAAALAIVTCMTLFACKSPDSGGTAVKEIGGSQSPRVISLVNPLGTCSLGGMHYRILGDAPKSLIAPTLQSQLARLGQGTWMFRCTPDFGGGLVIAPSSYVNDWNVELDKAIVFGISADATRRWHVADIKTRADIGRMFGIDGGQPLLEFFCSGPYDRDCKIDWIDGKAVYCQGSGCTPVPMSTYLVP